MICQLATGVRHEQVSSDSELLVLVDSLDRELGALSKDACHDGRGLLHRAFSVFLFNAEGELLLQQRSPDKRLWPNYWANSCCSHPLAGERISAAVERRVRQELGLTPINIEFVFKFEYQASYGDVGSEHELCHVFAAQTCEDPKANANEVRAWRWVSPTDLTRELRDTPDIFTPWLRLEWPQLMERHHV